MSKHTLGPWVVRHDDMVCSKEGRIIADCESTSYNMRPAPPIAEDKANAALIAAAPAMYEALKFLTSEIDLSKLNVRKDFSLMNAHAWAIKVILQAEGKLL